MNMTGWKTKFGGIGLILTGVGTMIGGILGCFDGNISEADLGAVVAGSGMLSTGIGMIGLGHKSEKNAATIAAALNGGNQKGYSVLGLLSAVVFLFFIVSFISCGTNTAAYRGVGTMKASYDAAMQSAVDLHSRGFISDEGRDEIIKIGDEYSTMHNAAVQAYQNYLNAPADQKDTKKKRAQLALAECLKVYSRLLDILTRHGIYGEPVEPWF